MTTLLATFSVALIAFIAIWTLSLRLRDASIVDIYWGPGFAVIGLVAFLMEGIKTSGQVLLLACLCAWSLRLGWYILRRHRGEDARYRAMREYHGAAFGQRSLTRVFLLQGIIQWMASAPVLVTAVSGDRPPGLLFAAGLALFALGFAIEILADRAVSRFRQDPENRGKLLTSGLHGVVRHPNYLGEIIVQWGLGIAAVGLSGNALALVGPALMTALIIKLSGVPLLEAQFKTRPGYADWAARTGALWPRFKRQQ